MDESQLLGRCPVCLLAEAFAPPRENGTLGQIGEFELIEEIARTGMSVVYRARQAKPERVVALKTVRGAELESPAALARFRQEVRAMADLGHPGILPVFTFGEQDGVPYFTMKFAAGGTLADRLPGYAGKWREIADLIANIADAVQHAHARAVLHRDLKPGNILFDESGQAFVSDFGLAKLLHGTDSNLTLTTAVLGTPYYIAPEIAARDSRAATTLSDVWSLGVILYELLAQRRPFDGDSIPATLRAITDTAPAPLRTRNHARSATASSSQPAIAGHGVAPLPDPPPRDLAVIAMKALAKDPTRRYASANALAEDLRRWLAGRPIFARPVSPLESTALWARRNPLLAMITALAAVLLIAGVLGITNQWRRAEAAERATRERLAHEHIRIGLRLAEHGDALRGLLHYVEALRLGLGDPAREHVSRIRFETTVRQSPRLAQLWLPALDGDCQFAEESGRVVINSGAETRVWDATTGEAVSPPIQHTAEVRRVWTDSWGSRVVICTRDDEITVWDTATGTRITTLPGEGHVRAVLGGSRLRLAVLRRDTGIVTCLSTLLGAVDGTFSHPETIEWAVTSPDGTRILAADKHSLLLWDVATGALVVPPVEFGGEPDFGNFDSAGRFAGLRVKHRGAIAVFDLTTGAITARGETKASGSIKHGWLDGTRWVVLTRKVGGSTLRDGATDRLIVDASFGARTVTAEFAAWRNIFALAGENGAAQLWDAETMLPLTPRLWADGRPARATLDGDGATLLFSSGEPAARLWKLPAQGGVVWSGDGTVPAVATWWDAAGAVLRTVGEDARLTARDANTGLPVGEAHVLDDAATCASATAEGRFVFVGGTHGARFWNAESGQPAGPRIPCAGAIRDVALSADGRSAAILLEKETLLCDPATGTVRHTLATEGTSRCVLGGDGARLVTLTKEAVQIWDAATGQPIGSPLVEGGKWRDPGATFDATGKRLAVWWSWPDTMSGSLRVLDAATGGEILPRLEHAAAVKQATFSAAGDLLATATRDQRLWLWRTSDGHRTLAPVQHDDRISDMGFSPDGLLVWSRSNREFRTWETATGDAVSLLRHRGPPPRKPTSPRGGPMDDDEVVRTIWSSASRVASSDSRGSVNVWDFSAGTRPLAEMETLARVLSTHRIEPSGGLVPLTRDELRAAWAAHRQ